MNKIKRLLISLPVWFYAIVSLFPLVWVLSQSLKTEREFLTSIWSFPVSMRIANYLEAWQTAKFSLYYQNSLLVTVLTLSLALFCASLAGYAFGRLHFAGRNVLLVMLVTVLLIPSPVFQMPVYLIIRDLGLLNTYAGLVGPYVAGAMPLGILIMRGFFQAMPQELADSAEIDGCTEFGTYWHVMLPLTKPAIATLSILFFMNVWNEYMWALISLSDPSLYTIPIGMANLASQSFVYGKTVVFAGIIISSAFIVIVFLIFQKYFVKAIAEGAVKG